MARQRAKLRSTAYHTIRFLSTASRGFLLGNFYPGEPLKNPYGAFPAVYAEGTPLGVHQRPPAAAGGRGSLFINMPWISKGYL